ncbi:MAG TPA: carboxylating nicotinate-nucleotide diphosphorylase [Acidimicrobiia bacterium]|nr:carboxylating nicotinate-nucleotide diphosphorylase [Acidimicrobiia bacterium]
MITGHDYADIVDRALAEDLDDAGDITSQTVIPAASRSRGRFIARDAGVIAGLPVAGYVFARVDDTVDFRSIEEGARVEAGASIATVSGPSRSILTAERTALNLLARMSGVATATARFVAAVEGTGARITDTRKTLPGLRVLDKYAVSVGGGVNHRMGLYDEVMIKDNHIVAAGNLKGAVSRARDQLGPDIRIIVEVETLDQLADVLTTEADRVLLDNMDTQTLMRAVEVVDGRLETEASGGVTLETVRAIAETGVDFISVGAITHSTPQLDIALDFV